LSAADAIATCALLFTIGSFWWLSARAGKLEIIGEPRSYAFAATQNKLHLNLPLVFNNSRPGAAVAINLRLCLRTPGFPSVVPFVATLDGLEPSKATRNREMATSIVIQGRETRLVCCEFISEPYDVKFTGPIEVAVNVEAYVLDGWWKWRRPVWRALLSFPLRLPQEAATQRNQYVSYDNQVSGLTIKSSGTEPHNPNVEAD
jgi:hypothetical protein